MDEATPFAKKWRPKGRSTCATQAHLSERAESKSKDLVKEDRSGGTPELHAQDRPFEEEVVVETAVVIADFRRKRSPSKPSRAALFRSWRWERSVGGQETRLRVKSMSFYKRGKGRYTVRVGNSELLGTAVLQDRPTRRDDATSMFPGCVDKVQRHS